ncbi:MAG: methyltransferase domain-containing protein [Aggregatilineales bacterium]|nr:class I SAM-dependent methyltransferase [Chloroflexota bacterium]HOA25855.1 methyltransferase domain-containing protein [Aggregatilineales bacterium]HPV05761.1 methyltransferase domain-containing protein [Aggregatilineales bacterium]HQE19693.1 methyltransferase domain-containing protein [Aggregatilineales bacterium]
MSVQQTPEDKPFDKYEKRGAYHWEWYRSNRYNYRDKVNMLLDWLPRTGEVLDIGGGDGLIAFQMFKRGLDVVCIDTNATSISLAREMCEKHVYGAGILKPVRWVMNRAGLTGDLVKRYEEGRLKLQVRSYSDIQPDETYDYVICHEVIEHIKEPLELLQVIHSSVREFAIISTPDVTHRPQHPLDYHGWTPTTFAELLSDYRFEFLVKDGWNMYVKLYK